MFFITPLSAEKFLPQAYNSFAGEFSQTRHSKWTEFEDLAGEYEQEKKILDIGCGNGRLRKFLEEKNFAGEYYGRDIAKKFLDHAKKNLSEYSDIFFSTGGFLDLQKNFEKNFFDEIWAVASFHHLSQHAHRAQALSNIADILQEEGSIVLTVWNLWDQKKYIPQKKQAKIRACWNPFFSERDFLIPWGTKKVPRYYYSFSKKYLTDLLQQSGFEIEKIFYSDTKRNLCVRARKTVNRISQQNRALSEVEVPASLSELETKKFHIKKIPFDSINEKKALEKIFSYLDTNSYHKIFTPNPEMVVECKKNKKFLQILQTADLSLADGNGILWASGLYFLEGRNIFWRWVLGIFSLFQYAFFRKKFPSLLSKPICGSDIFRKFLEQSQKFSKEKQPKIFLLGGIPHSAQTISQKFSTIVGHYDGIVNKKNTQDIISQINSSEATVLFVALGAPKQEIFIHENEKFLPNIRIAMGVGGSFDFLSGHQTRAPKIFRTLGIEWLYRLCKEPSRASRIWNATGRFITIIINTQR